LSIKPLKIARLFLAFTIPHEGYKEYVFVQDLCSRYQYRSDKQAQALQDAMENQVLIYFLSMRCKKIKHIFPYEQQMMCCHLMTSFPIYVTRD
jgi:hypothetical protein